MGISTDRIINASVSSIDHLLCSICHEILWHPVTCETCEHSFCETCLKQWFQRQQRCPNNCQYRQRARSPHILIQLLSDLKVSCKNTANGCNVVVSYEESEHHEETCDYEMKQCQGCLVSLLKQDINKHELQCGHVEILCNNCQVTYRRQDGHDAIHCIANQIKIQNDLFEKKLTSLENDIRQQTELLNNIDQQQKGLIERLDRQTRETEEKTRKIIRFDDVPHYSSSQTPCSYNNFLWNGCGFIFSTDFGNERFQNAFKPDQQCILYSCLSVSNYNVYGTTGKLSISALKTDETFNVESIEALALIDNNSPNIDIMGLRNTQKCFTRSVNLHNELQLITLNWTNIDTLTFECYCQTGVGFAMSQIVLTLS